jgi:4-hydroxybenzoate polyprenyltransferase
MSDQLQLARLLRCIRWADVLILEGTPILGVAFSLGPITAAKLTMSIFFGAASLLLLTHIFTFNDWADSAHIGFDSSATKSSFRCANIPSQVLLSFSLSILAASLLLLLFISARLFLLGGSIAALGIFYSHPSFNAKSMPIVSTLLHFAGGMLHFLLGYALFSAIDLRGVLVGMFFGVTFAAGHPIQEVRDFHEDQRMAATTNAIVFGPRPSFFVGVILFAVQYLYLFFLAWSGFIPRFLAILPIVFSPIHLLWTIFTLRDGLDSESITRFQNRYRILYALIGVAMLAAFLCCRSLQEI